MQGKHLATGLLILMFGGFAIICWIGLSGGSQHVPASERARTTGQDAPHGSEQGTDHAADRANDPVNDAGQLTDAAR